MDGMLIAGDAARFTDPLTGGGIINGMNSGKFAGEVAAEYLNEGVDLKVYEKGGRSVFRTLCSEII
jgi:2,3-di-O-geranylgeranylglyceryl phosphate reductase (EC 1.3.99.-)